jgi:polysaccharide deacetylase 2 family uncharacterized protein YibQ
VCYLKSFQIQRQYGSSVDILKYLIAGLIAHNLLLANTAMADLDTPAFVAIIIDDLGHNLRDGNRALGLPGSITYSILPYTRHSHDLARMANNSGREVMLHMPMENVRDHDIGPDGLTSRLNKAEFVSTLHRALAQVPFARGVNNHMGSFLTQQPEQMHWLMDEISEKQIYFVDSRTTPLTVAADIAKQNQILESSRDIFLDNIQSFYAIDQSFRYLIRLARSQGSAIAICHPHAMTLAYLEIALPLLEGEGIQLIPASSLLAMRSTNLTRNSLAGTTSASKRPGDSLGSE